MFDHFRLDNCTREISLTRLIPRVNPSRRARGAYRRYVAANYGHRYHHGKPRGSCLERGPAVPTMRNSSNRRLRLAIPAISEARARRGVNSTRIVRFYYRSSTCPFVILVSEELSFERYSITFSSIFLLTFHQALQYVGVKASCQSGAGRMHTRIGIDLDQPDRHIFGQHEIGTVQFEAATAPLHVILRRQHHQNDGLRHFRVNQIVVRFAFMAYWSKKVNDSFINFFSKLDK